MNSIGGKTVYTGDKVLKNAYVVFDGRKIAGVSTKKKGRLLGEYPVVTPACIVLTSGVVFPWPGCCASECWMGCDEREPCPPPR